MFVLEVGVKMRIKREWYFWWIWILCIWGFLYNDSLVKIVEKFIINNLIKVILVFYGVEKINLLVICF